MQERFHGQPTKYQEFLRIVLQASSCDAVQQPNNGGATATPMSDMKEVRECEHMPQTIRAVLTHTLLPFQIVQQVSSLFEGHPDLMEEFHVYLPAARSYSAAANSAS